MPKNIKSVNYTGSSEPLSEPLINWQLAPQALEPVFTFHIRRTKSHDVNTFLIGIEEVSTLNKLLTPCLRHVSLTSFAIRPLALRQSLLGAAPPNPRFRS